MCPLYSPNMSLYLTLFHCLSVYLFFQHRRWFSKVISERYILQRTKCFHQNKSWTHCEERREVSLPGWKGTPLLVSLFKQGINISTVIKALLAIIYSWTASSGDISSVTIGLRRSWKWFYFKIEPFQFHFIYLLKKNTKYRYRHSIYYKC